ncbi:MAG: anti-sigma factor family protein [Acidobacteriota bacterium]
MSLHLGPERLLAYLGKQLSEAEKQQIERHLDVCRDCQRQVEAEKGFDEMLRTGVGYQPAPAALLTRIHTGLEALVQEEEALQPIRNTWFSLAASALAASLILALFLQPAAGRGHLSEGLVAAGAVLPASRIVRGHLVCLGCARDHLDQAYHRFCLGTAGRGHITGLQTSDGHLWRFVEDATGDSLMEDKNLRGRTVELEARPFDEIGYLQVAAIHRL